MKIRNMIKNAHKRLGAYDAREPFYKENADGGYTALHPTKGYQTVSGKRVRAQERMMDLFGFVR